MGNSILEIKLSKLQKKVIADLQDGWVLVTNSDNKGSWVSKNGNEDYHINSGVFWRLVNKGIIHQQISWPFNYVLTTLGETLK